jgi:hypothetical protein
MKTTNREAAERLLELHSGACSVPQSSALAAEFLAMQGEGSVSLRPSGTAGYIDIYRQGFVSRFGLHSKG